MISPADIQIGVLRRDLQRANERIKHQQRSLDAVGRELTAERKSKKVVIRAAERRPRLKGDIIRMIGCDVHGAKMSRKAVAAFLGDVKAIQPHELILNGDIIDCGGFLAEHHVMGYVAETDYSYSDDCNAANGFLDGLRAGAPNATIEYIEGNHERRVETWCVTEALRNAEDAEMLRLAISPETKLRLEERGIKYYRQSLCYDGLRVPGVIKRGKIFYLHGISTSKNAAAATLAKVAGNVVYAHTHRAQSDILRPMGTGTIGAWNPGSLCELQPLWQHTRPTDWTHGHAIEFISRTGKFLHLNVPIIDGISHLTSLLKYGP